MYSCKVAKAREACRSLLGFVTNYPVATHAQSGVKQSVLSASLSSKNIEIRPLRTVYGFKEQDIYAYHNCKLRANTNGMHITESITESMHGIATELATGYVFFEYPSFWKGIVLMGMVFFVVVFTNTVGMHIHWIHVCDNLYIIMYTLHLRNTQYMYALVILVG